jgi:PhoPQ-activated pathogenicity-related protein
MRPRPAALFAAIAVALSLSAVPPARGGDLPAYLGAEQDPAFSWEVAASVPVPGATLHVVKLTSQVWQGITWRHWLRVIVPQDLRHPEDAVLIISGGRFREQPPAALTGEALLLPSIANKTGAILCLLEQVPNQPLFGGKREDALIAYTFERFLETGDESWPALLPMTRSAIRAMDAVQAFSAGKLGKKVERFYVTGASKRGWTTWLTAAADSRVKALAPMVIDVLNMSKQMPHQLEMFGDYSEQIHDYTLLGLPQKVASPEAARLLALVDPYSYRERLTAPKLVVLGTNDPYWPVDAVNLYFGDLAGEKYIHYEPNAGHGLGPGAYEAITGFFSSLMEGEKRPQFRWERRATADGGASIVVSAGDPPLSVEVFSAESPSRDFRKAEWTGAPLARGADGRYVASIAMPEKGARAAYVALRYRNGRGDEYTLCTNVEVVARPRRASF